MDEDIIDCWACFEEFPSSIKRERKGFKCPNCGQYNGLNDHSSHGFNKLIPEYYDESLNERGVLLESDIDPNEVGFPREDQELFFEEFTFCASCDGHMGDQERNPCRECSRRIVQRLTEQHDEVLEEYVEPNTRVKIDNIRTFIVNIVIFVLYPLEISFFFIAINSYPYDVDSDFMFPGSDLRWYFDIAMIVCCVILLISHGFLFPVLLIVSYYGGWVLEEDFMKIGMCFFLTLCKTIIWEYSKYKNSERVNRRGERRYLYFYSHFMPDERL